MFLRQGLVDTSLDNLPRSTSTQSIVKSTLSFTVKTNRYNSYFLSPNISNTCFEEERWGKLGTVEEIGRIFHCGSTGTCAVHRPTLEWRKVLLCFGRKTGVSSRSGPPDLVPIGVRLKDWSDKKGLL